MRFVTFSELFWNNCIIAYLVCLLYNNHQENGELNCDLKKSRGFCKTVSGIEESLNKNIVEEEIKKNRRIKRMVCIVAAILIIICTLVVIGVCAYTMKKTAAYSVAIIGGADGPTSVFLAGKFGGNAQDMESGNRELELVKVQTNENIANLPLRMYMEVADYSFGVVTVYLNNQSGYEMTYGHEYYLDYRDDNQWFELEPVYEYEWNDEEVIIKDLEQSVEVYDLNVFGELKPGQYRLRKNDMEAEFELK